MRFSNTSIIREQHATATVNFVIAIYKPFQAGNLMLVKRRTAPPRTRFVTLALEFFSPLDCFVVVVWWVDNNLVRSFWNFERRKIEILGVFLLKIMKFNAI